MEKYDVVLNTKGLRKAAFAVGFGLCMGKAVAKAVDMFVCAAVGVVLDHTVDKLSDDDNIRASEMMMLLNNAYARGYSDCMTDYDLVRKE